MRARSGAPERRMRPGQDLRSTYECEKAESFADSAFSLLGGENDYGVAIRYCLIISNLHEQFASEVTPR